jgi:DNA repair exonuclease SbcCD ATPase subunit
MADEYDEMKENTEEIISYIDYYLRKINAVNDQQSLASVADRIESTFSSKIDESVAFFSSKLPPLKSVVKELEKETYTIVKEEDDLERDEPMTEQRIEEYKRSLQGKLETIKLMVSAFLPSRDLTRLMKTEKEPLSKLPEDIVNNITHFLSARRGTLLEQINELRTEAGLPPLPPKKEGGRKTKKNRSRRKKTHGRRV